MDKEQALNILTNVVKLSLKSGVFEEPADVSVVHQALIVFANDVMAERETATNNATTPNTQEEEVMVTNEMPSN